MILDPETFPSEIKDALETAGLSLGKGLVYLRDGDEPENNDARVVMLGEAFQRSLTALAMIILVP